MRPFLFLFALAASSFAEKPNVLLICVDDLRPDIHALGAEHIHSPAMDSLIGSGRAFTRHYVQAPTCGASRYALLTGKYAEGNDLRGNGALMSAAKDADKEPFSMPKHFRENGYRTVSVGKVSHYPGGLGGEGWADPEKPEMPGAWDVSVMPTDDWENPEVAMHSYAGGKGRERGVTPVNEHVEGDDLTYTDGWITRESLRQMEELSGKGEPFFLAVGIMKPHLPFACPKKYWDLYEGVEFPPIAHPEKPEGLNTWHRSGEFMGYNREGRDPREDAAYAAEMRRSYAACVSYADAQVAQLLESLEKNGLAENTIVVLWGDHGWHLGEHGIWGKHALYEESLHAPLVIRAPGMEEAGVVTDSIVETVDVYPTLCELTGVEAPDGLSGRSLAVNLRGAAEPGRPAFSYFGKRETIRTDRYRLIRHKAKGGGYQFELYDHSGNDGETTNLAGQKPEVVSELNGLIEERME